MIIGIDIGGTKIKAVAMTDGKKTVGRFEQFTHAGHGYTAVLNDLRRCAQTAAGVETSGQLNGAAVGIAVPGLVDEAGGRVVSAPNLGWEKKTLAEDLGRITGWKIRIGNDARCAALAEAKAGAGKKYESMLLLTLGTAVGAALVYRGEVFRGMGAFGAEPGHIPLVHGGLPCSCGIRGCFEQYGSATALIRIMKEKTALRGTGDRNEKTGECLREMSAGSGLSAEEILAAAEAGDRDAAEAVEEYLQYLSEGAAGLVNIFHPEAVVLGGGLAESGGRKLAARVEQEIRKRTAAAELIGHPAVCPAGLGRYAGAIGAALMRKEGAR